MRLRHKQTNCVCLVCGAHFIAFSTRARTCTEVCRKRLSRQRRKGLVPVPQYADGPLTGIAAAAGIAGFTGARAHNLRPRTLPLSPIERFLRLAAPDMEVTRQAPTMH